MSPCDLLRELFKRGIFINLDGTDNIRLRSEESPLPADIVALAKERKPELLEYLKRMTSLKVGMLVTCPNGVGRVWEVYPALDRCGVLINGQMHPQFFSILEIELGNAYATKMH